MVCSPKESVSEVLNPVGKGSGVESAALLDGCGASSSPGRLCVHLRSGSGSGRCPGCGPVLTAARPPMCRRPAGVTPPPAPKPAAAASAGHSGPPWPRSARIPAVHAPTDKRRRSARRTRQASRGWPIEGAGVLRRARQPRASAHPSYRCPPPHSWVSRRQLGGALPLTNFLPYKSGCG